MKIEWQFENISYKKERLIKIANSLGNLINADSATIQASDEHKDELIIFYRNGINILRIGAYDYKQFGSQLEVDVPLIKEDKSNDEVKKILRMDVCKRCGEEAWDGYICLSCGLNMI